MEEKIIITHAEILSDAECKRVYDFHKEREINKITLSLDLISINYNKLVEYYHEYEDDRIQKAYSEMFLGKTLGFIKAYNTKICEACSSKMKLIKSRDRSYNDFWGCPNYRDPSGREHTSFPAKIYIDIESTWVTDIIKKANLKGSVRVTHLHSEFLKNGLEDLKEKHGLSRTVYDSFLKAKDSSLADEKDIIKIFKEREIKCVDQTGIRYKTKGGETKTGFIDLIISFEDIVAVLEVKRSYYFANDIQLDTYYEVIKFIMEMKGDKRKIVKGFVYSEYMPGLAKEKELHVKNKYMFQVDLFHMGIDELKAEIRNLSS